MNEIGMQPDGLSRIAITNIGAKSDLQQGCQMVYFQTKNPNLGKIWTAVEWKKLLYFMTVWNIFRSFGIIYSRLEYFVVMWYIFPVLVCLDQEKSGNPDSQTRSSVFSASAAPP
jgi:hypothetical protein